MPTPESADVREYAKTNAEDPWILKVHVLTAPVQAVIPFGVVVRALSLLMLQAVILAVGLWLIVDRLDDVIALGRLGR